jgi:hypothetical protein
MKLSLFESLILVGFLFGIFQLMMKQNQPRTRRVCVLSQNEDDGKRRLYLFL